MQETSSGPRRTQPIPRTAERRRLLHRLASAIGQNCCFDGDQGGPDPLCTGTMRSPTASISSPGQMALLTAAWRSAALACLVLSALAFFPSALRAQRPCPDSPFPRVLADGTSPIYVVARLTGVIFDREPPDEGALPYVSLPHAILTYQPLAALLGHRDDSRRDFYGELPKAGGLFWTVGATYLLVLVPLPDSPDQRTAYWTAACYGTREVSGLEEAKRILDDARRR